MNPCKICYNDTCINSEEGEQEKLQIKEFLKTLTTDPRARELLKGRKEPKNGKEAIQQYAEIAKELGIKVSQKGLEAFLEFREKLQRKKTEEAGNAVKVALSENTLNSVAGGWNEDCVVSYEKGEWCWLSDSCAVVITSYSKPLGLTGVNLDAPCEIQDRPGAVPLEPVRGDVTFDRVSFAYQPGNPVLNVRSVRSRTLRSI